MSTCCCTGLRKWTCTHWTSGGLTPTQFDFGMQQLAASAGIMPDPKRELWSDWQWLYLR